MRKAKTIFFSAMLASVLVISSVPTFAQQVQGTLTGTVTDTQGAAVQGVQVKAVNKATNLTQTVTTNNNGEYTFPELPIGTYNVSFIKDGFKTEDFTEIILEANRSTTVDASLQTGEVSATVTVTASPLLDKTDPTNGYVLGTSVLETAPVGTGSFTQLTTLSPGVNADFLTGSGTNAGLGNQSIFANGQRGTSNSFSINNIGANNLFNGQTTSDVGDNRFVLNTGEHFLGGGQIQTNTGVFTAVGEALPTPPLETIEELRVNTSMYDSQQGANAGAHIELITKSGTNGFHGEVYEHFQNSAFNAAPFFFNADPVIPANQKVPYLDRNAFGATLGGPIIKDKLFFFVSYQRTQAVDDLNGTSIVNVPLGLTNDRSPAALAALAGISPSALNPAAVSIFNLKLPNGAFLIPSSGFADTVAGEAQTTALGGNAEIMQQATFKANQGNGNIDYVVNSKDRLAFKYYYQDDPTFSPFAISPLAGQPQSLLASGQTGSITNTTILSPSVVWEQKAGLLRETAFATTQNLVSPSQVGINLFGSTQFPGIDIRDANPPIDNTLEFGPNSNFANAGFFQNQLSFGSTLTWVKGRHSFSFGGNFDIGQLNVANLQDSTAVLNFTSLKNFLEGTVRDTSEYFNGAANRYYRYNQAGAYAQDKWKITSNLTLSLGLRFDYDGPLTEKYGNLTNFNPALYKFDQATDTIINDGLVVAGNNKKF
ncbi:MAG TPA: carboxypeptidase regulatory-like domain-containing protein, partial [Blastocatellia bacterium]